mmetsp:Transcript_92714/g.233084  ORF Transcript_92714/g.233084 Transcript_92714/m.233084 type:complete len:328 (-) Transcript_92714:472-1455(-)
MCTAMRSTTTGLVTAFSPPSRQDVVGRAIRVQLREDGGKVLIHLRAARLEGCRQELLLVAVLAHHALDPVLLVPWRVVLRMDVLLRDPQEALQLLGLGRLLELREEQVAECVRTDDRLLVAGDAVLLRPLHDDPNRVADHDDHRDVRHLGLLRQEDEVRVRARVLVGLLNLLHGDVLSQAGLKHVLLPVHDPQATAIVEATDVAGLEPRPTVLFEEILVGLLLHPIRWHPLLEAAHRGVVVAFAHARPADPNLATALVLLGSEAFLRLGVLVIGLRAAVVVHVWHVDEADSRGPQGSANVSGSRIEGHGQRRRRSGLGGAVALDHRG